MYVYTRVYINALTLQPVLAHNWNLAAFLILLVAASAGGVLPSAFMPDINPQNPTSPTCALVTDFNFTMDFSNNPCLSATPQVSVSEVALPFICVEE